VKRKVSWRQPRPELSFRAKRKKYIYYLYITILTYILRTCHAYVLSTAILVQVRSAQSNTSATIQRHYANRKSPKRYIVQQYSATMHMGKVQSDISATIQRHYANRKSPKRYICNNTAPLCESEKSKAIYLQQDSATMRIGKVQSDISATRQRHYAHGKRPKRHNTEKANLLYKCDLFKVTYLKEYR
jgi:hypothetical protein